MNLPRYSREERICEPIQEIHLARRRNVAAAPVAGGWGIVDPQHVYSVGFSMWPAGGAEEEVVRSARCFLRSSAVKSSSSPSSRVFGSVKLVSPSPALAWRSGRIVMKQKKEVIWSLAMEMMAYGVGS
jgi:hypothetical protein